MTSEKNDKSPPTSFFVIIMTIQSVVIFYPANILLVTSAQETVENTFNILRKTQNINVTQN